MLGSKTPINSNVYSRQHDLTHARNSNISHLATEHCIAKYSAYIYANQIKIEEYVFTRFVVGTISLNYILVCDKAKMTVEKKNLFDYHLSF